MNEFEKSMGALLLEANALADCGAKFCWRSVIGQAAGTLPTTLFYELAWSDPPAAPLASGLPFSWRRNKVCPDTMSSPATSTCQRHAVRWLL